MLNICHFFIHSELFVRDIILPSPDWSAPEAGFSLGLKHFAPFNITTSCSRRNTLRLFAVFPNKMHTLKGYLQTEIFTFVIG